MTEVMPSDLIEASLALGTRAWETGSEQQELMRYSQGTTTRHLDVRAVPLDDRVLLVSSRDVTAQHADRQKLEHHRRLLGLLQEMTESGHWEWSEAERRLWLSPRAAAIFGLADPVSQITIRSRSRSGGAVDQVFQRCFDGKGRKVQDRSQVAPGRFQVFGFSVFNNRGNEVESFQPYISTEAGCAMSPPTRRRRPPRCPKPSSSSSASSSPRSCAARKATSAAPPGP